MSGVPADPGQSPDLAAAGQSPDLAAAEVYHVELRQFPHNVCRFNLTEQELQATVVERWAQEQWIEVEGRKWSPHQARLTVLRGPRVPLEQLSMGRGWRAAQRDSQDVTADVLVAAKQAAAGAGAQAQPMLAGGEMAPPPPGVVLPGTDEALLADSLGLELLAALGVRGAPLRRAWELAGERHPQRTAGERLVLAERAIASLLRSRLIVLAWGGGTADARRPMGTEEVEAMLRSIDSWSEERVDPGDAASVSPVWISRA
jgi:hypothetical protein